MDTSEMTLVDTHATILARLEFKQTSETPVKTLWLWMQSLDSVVRAMEASTWTQYQGDVEIEKEAARHHARTS